MKIFRVSILIPLLSLMCAAQSISSIPSTTSPYLFPDHPLHASVHDMGIEQNLLTGAYSTGVGERPLFEVYKPAAEIPLGTIARICKADDRDSRCTYKGEL